MSRVPLRSALAGVLCSAAPLFAQEVVYDNFGPGDSFNENFVWAARGGSELQDDVDVAMPFVPSESGPLAEILIATISFEGANEVDIWLMDSAADTPDTILESWHFTGAMGNVGDPPILATSEANTPLEAGTQYWLAVSAPVADSIVGWHWNDTGAMGHSSLRTNGGDWVPAGDPTLGAFRVSVVPEPAALALLAGGTLVLRRRRRR